MQTAPLFSSQNGSRVALETLFADLWERSVKWEHGSSLWEFTLDMDTWQLISDGPALKLESNRFFHLHARQQMQLPVLFICGRIMVQRKRRQLDVSNNLKRIFARDDRPRAALGDPTEAVAEHVEAERVLTKRGDICEQR